MRSCETEGSMKPHAEAIASATSAICDAHRVCDRRDASARASRASPVKP